MLAGSTTNTRTIDHRADDDDVDDDDVYGRPLRSCWSPR
jgi:hypothetical protein